MFSFEIIFFYKLLEKVAAAQTRMAVTEDWRGNPCKDSRLLGLQQAPADHRTPQSNHLWCPHLLLWIVHFGKRKKKGWKTYKSTVTEVKELIKS